MKKEYFKIRRNSAITALLCVVSSLTFCGCNNIAGYSNESVFDSTVHSVYVEMFDNATFWRGTEYELSDSLAKRIEADTPYKIVSSRDRADTVISGKITYIGEGILSIEREYGNVLEKEFSVKAVITWKNLKTGKLLIENDAVTGTASYSSYQNQNLKYASSVAANKLAEKIVELMETKW